MPSQTTEPQKRNSGLDTDLSDDESESLEEEEVLANELLAEQEIAAADQELKNLHQEGKQFGSPSVIKYLILIILAASQDLVDFADLSGIGAIFSFGYSLLSFTVISFIFWFTDSRMILAKEYAKGLDGKILKIRTRMVQATRLIGQKTLKAAKYGRKIKALRPLIRKSLRVVNKTKRYLNRNPITKILFFGVIDLIPGAGILPWMTFSIILSYLDERGILKEARESADEVFEDEEEKAA